MENSLTSIKLLAKTVSEQKIKETEPSYHEQLTQLDDSNSETITLDESPDQNGLPTQPKQKQKGAKSKKKIKSYDFKKETAQLKKHNKKLDQMQNKLKATESDRAEPSSKNTMAYCVKCKEKRLVANPQSTIMKNGRSAIKGTCSVCACKVFRIVKKQ